jgi:hypothetical protein
MRWRFSRSGDDEVVEVHEHGARGSAGASQTAAPSARGQARDCRGTSSHGRRPDLFRARPGVSKSRANGPVPQRSPDPQSPLIARVPDKPVDGVRHLQMPSVLSALPDVASRGGSTLRRLARQLVEQVEQEGPSKIECSARTRVSHSRIGMTCARAVGLVKSPVRPAPRVLHSWRGGSSCCARHRGCAPGCRVRRARRRRVAPCPRSTSRAGRTWTCGVGPRSPRTVGSPRRVGAHSPRFPRADATHGPCGARYRGRIRPTRHGLVRK